MFSVTNFCGFGSGPEMYDPAKTPSLQAWLDFSNVASFTTSGASVTRVNDRTGTCTLTGSAGCYPLYMPGAQNGLGVLDFSGTNGAGLTGPYNTALAPLSFVGAAVYLTTSTSQPSRLISLDRAPGINGAVVVGISNSALPDRPMVFTAGPSLHAGTFTSAPDIWRVYSGIRRTPGGTSTLRVDGGVFSEGAIGTATVTATSTALWIGVSTFGAVDQWRGQIGEVRIFNSALSAADLFKEEGYLAWKWGLQGNLPSDHPYKNAPP